MLLRSVELVKSANNESRGPLVVGQRLLVLVLDALVGVEGGWWRTRFAILLKLDFPFVIRHRLELSVETVRSVVIDAAHGAQPRPGR